LIQERPFRLLPVIALVLVLGGCASSSVDMSEPTTRHALRLLMPTQIIVEPFTRLKSFDDDALPDGLQVVIRPIDSFGDPVKIAGTIMVELYKVRPASGESAGEKVEQWNLRLATDRDQRRYWNRVTQMYEIPLMFRPEMLAGAVSDKYLVRVTYNTPLGEHMVADYEFSPPTNSSHGLTQR